MKSVFVGQQPNSHADEGTALPVRPGTSGSRLMSMMGLDYTTFKNTFLRVNVSAIYDPDGFSPSYHQPHAQNLLPLLEGRHVVLLGPAVAEAFKWKRSEYEYCRFYDHPHAHLLWAVIPHPSGLNRLYNDPEVVRQVTELLQYLWRIRDG